MFTVPLYFQVTARASVTNAGAHLFPAVFGNALGGLICGFIIRRFMDHFPLSYTTLISHRTASYKLLTIGGTVASSIAYVLLILLWRGNTNIWESLYIGPGGFGTGVVLATTFVGLAAGIEKSDMAIASSGIYLSANVGSLVGMSLASTVLQTTLRSGLKERLKGSPDRDSVRPNDRCDRFASTKVGIRHLTKG